jgi:hypothetical protein
MTTPAFNTIYTHYTDEVARLATITIEADTTPSRSGGAAYGPASLVDDNPAKVAKINEDDTGAPATGPVSGAWIFAYEDPQPIAFAALIHTTAADPAVYPTASVRLEGNTTADFSAPAFSAAFVIPPWLGRGRGRWPQNPYMRVDTEAGYDPAGFLFWRLVFENQPENIQVGEVRFHPSYYQCDPDLRWGLSVRSDKPQIENRTAFGVSTLYARGTTIWEEEADIMLTDTMRAALEDHWYDVEGRTRPWVIVPSGPVRDDRCYLVRYALTDERVQWDLMELTRQRLQFQEVGRGLRPGI